MTTSYRPLFGYQSITLFSLGQELDNEPKLNHNISIFPYEIPHNNIVFHNYFMT